MEVSLKKNRRGENWMGQGPVYTMVHEVGHHGRCPFSMVRIDGPTSMIRFLKESIYKAFRPLNRWKPNVDQEEWMTMRQRVNKLIFFKCLKKEGLKNIQVWPLFSLLLSSSSLT